MSVLYKGPGSGRGSEINDLLRSQSFSDGDRISEKLHAVHLERNGKNFLDDDHWPSRTLTGETPEHAKDPETRAIQAEEEED